VLHFLVVLVLRESTVPTLEVPPKHPIGDVQVC